jgi:hypothetical protein
MSPRLIVAILDAHLPIHARDDRPFVHDNRRTGGNDQEGVGAEGVRA